MEFQPSEQLVVDGTVTCAKRWVWFEDDRTWAPVLFPISFRGEWPMYPLVVDIKKHLLNTYSKIGAELQEDWSSIQVFMTKRDPEAVARNEDPLAGKELPDDWCVNERTFLWVAIKREFDIPWCYFKKYDYSGDDKDDNGDDGKTFSEAKSNDDKISSSSSAGKKNKEKYKALLDAYKRGLEDGKKQKEESNRTSSSGKKPNEESSRGSSGWTDLATP